MGYTYDRDGKRTGYSPGKKTLYHDKRGEGHNMGYDEYKVRKKLAIEATRRADNEDTIAKSKAEEVAFVKAENARIAYDKDYQEGLERAETGQASQALRDKYLEFLADTQVNTNKQEVDAEGAEQSKWEENEIKKADVFAKLKAQQGAKYAEEARIKEAANRRDSDLEFFKQETSGYVDDSGFNQDWINSVINDAVNKGIKEDKAATPVFKVGGGVGKTFSGGSLQNDFISPALDLSGMMDVINGGDRRIPDVINTDIGDANVDFTTAKQRQAAADKAKLLDLGDFEATYDTNLTSNHGEDGFYLKGGEDVDTEIGYQKMFDLDKFLYNIK